MYFKIEIEFFQFIVWGSLFRLQWAKQHSVTNGTVNCLKQFFCKIIPHPTYSSGLSPSTYITFCSRTQHLPYWINKDATSTSNFQPISFLDPGCWYNFTYLMTNSADLDQFRSQSNWNYTVFKGTYPGSACRVKALPVNVFFVPVKKPRQWLRSG